MQFFIIVFLLFTAFLLLGRYWLLRERKYIKFNEGNEAAEKYIKRILRSIIIWFSLAMPFIIYLSLLGDETFQQKLPYTLAIGYMTFAMIILLEGFLVIWFGKNGIIVKHRNKPNE